mmetsp:Transcript_21173/g.25761  ORF Transcript_21173/g.25761 Transcript_21173/m.25761 type:complete len:287 (+) Transcript_21173:292-1152(+)|eukprot:CAMPEP_0204823412 /NCGR_PEP_ID=MMETSP1346-20131115/1465_1 /ASSEMBLY_ACC=CAM_ASM_000771 /TAXON_ID=215587 /ORGANISM="Aplanochytrium stocchinoi, Strain GSBS06" /LENGTH=286 /DNA_ID=CAMNT_0051950039 /DNA_START=227 /DNA_END=1087 /DNA_ORIENTATION=+
MSPRKRKAIDFSEDLREKLLELAGIVIKKEVAANNNNNAKENAYGDNRNSNNSTFETSASIQAEANTTTAVTKTEEKKKPKLSFELRREAVTLKHRGDKVKGPLKHLIYLRAGLKFMEHAESVDSSQQARQYRSTGNYISSIANVAEEAAKVAEKKGEIEHFVILNYKLAAIAYMRTFAIRSVKLKQVRDGLAIKLKRDNSNKVPGASSGHYDHLSYFVQEMNDVLLGLHLWRKADEYLSEINEQNDQSPKLKQQIDSLPKLELYVDNSQVLPMIETVKNCVNAMY